MSNPKEFDAVQMMREIRDKMSADMQDMSHEEQVKYIEERAKIVRRQLNLKRVRRAA